MTTPAPIATVLLARPVPQAYDYLAGDADLAVGQVVRAPFGNSQALGVITGFRDRPENPDVRLKAITEALTTPAVPNRTLDFVRWLAWYNQHPEGAVLKMALRGAEPAKRPRKTPIPEPNPDHPGRTLNPSQHSAAASLGQALDDHMFSTWLLDGVTGSGKTETYFAAIAHLLRRDPTAQVLVLTPEIALSGDVGARFADRFGAEPPIWHADIAEGRRKQIWQAVARNQARCVIGARSALFLPFQNLRLIIVDEEHDSSYKQEEGLTYHARDMAVARAHIEQAVCVLASATPSLESQWNAAASKYGHLRLGERAGGAQKPDLQLVDMRATPPDNGTFLAPPLRQAIAETLAKGEQSLLFLNRRGYAPLTLCRTCGHRLTAPGGENYLVEHKHTGRLVCHLTGFSMRKPKACPECGEETLVSVGPGVERIAEEAQETFPDARVEILSSDLSDTPKVVAARLKAMEAGEIDILVATQMAAKGHNFPNLTLVGVVDADLGLRGADLRAAERTFQVVNQVAGRAGRAEKPGRALIQTYDPDNTTMQTVLRQDREAFVRAELNERQALGLPPFGRLVAVVVSGKTLGQVEGAAETLARTAPQAAGFDLYGPAEPVHGRIRGVWRRRLLLRADLGKDVQGYLKAWRQSYRLPRSVTVQFDVDPQSFF